MRRSWFRASAGLSGAFLLGAMALAQAQRPPMPPPGAPGDPFEHLSPMQRTRFQTGLDAFNSVEDVAGGLGPVFTENSCVACHSSGATGGAGLRTVTRIGRLVLGQYDPMVEFGGPLIQNRGIGKFNGVNFIGEVVPKEATIVALRRTTPLFGLGLVDAVPDQVFQQIAMMEAMHSPATAGRVSVVPDFLTGHDRVGRFGWKAQHESVFAFVADAYANELGVTTPAVPNENCPQGNCSLLKANPADNSPNDPDNSTIQQLTDFITFLAPPPRTPLSRDIQDGQIVFQTLGCDHCHLPQLQTGPSSTAALNFATFFPFSDFLLHDMGGLGDGIVQNHAGPREIRTAPLWGLRFEPSFLHDGRAKSIGDAILAHDGQGRQARNAYQSLSRQQQSQLLAFLNSL